MAWAEAGKKAVFFHNGGASETCIGTYWYQATATASGGACRTPSRSCCARFTATPRSSPPRCTQIAKGKEVVVPCMADGNKEHLHLRRASIQRLKASLKLLDYDPKTRLRRLGRRRRGLRGVQGRPSSSANLRDRGATFRRRSRRRDWRQLDRGELQRFQVAEGKAPIGYGEDEIATRKGTTIDEKGQDFLFRRRFDVPAELLRNARASCSGSASPATTTRPSSSTA